jgi:hypothetical protein
VLEDTCSCSVTRTDNAFDHSRSTRTDDASMDALSHGMGAVDFRTRVHLVPGGLLSLTIVPWCPRTGEEYRVQGKVP